MKLAALLIAAAMVVPAAASAITYDAHADFSAASNPNGVYTYGYEAVLGGALTPFTSGGPVNGQPEAWTSPGVDQYLGVYNTATTILQHPGQAGQYSILRLTIMTTGQYAVSGAYSNGDNATTDVHILTNGISAFDGAINGVGSTTGFDFTQFLTAGSTVDFAVGYGGNGYNNDSTLLRASVAVVPEPAAWALMIAGFGLVGLAARRRRPVAA